MDWIIRGQSGVVASAPENPFRDQCCLDETKPRALMHIVVVFLKINLT